MGLAEDTISETVDRDSLVPNADTLLRGSGDIHTTLHHNQAKKKEVIDRLSLSDNDVLCDAEADFKAHDQSSVFLNDKYRNDNSDENLDFSSVVAKLNKLKSSADQLCALLTASQSAGTAGVRKSPGQTSTDDSKASTEEGDFSHLPGKGVVESIFDFTLQVFKQPEVFVQHYTDFAKELLKIVQNKSEVAPERGDRRFRDGVWQENIIYRMVLQTYLAWSNEMHDLVDDLDFSDESDQKRANFLLNQLTSAMSPSNSLLNPVSVKRAYQTGGQSILQGLKNIALDIKTNHGMPRQVPKDAYEVGKDLGVSDGAVVYRGPTFELIQYNCGNSSSVYRRPVLIVPPQINKFYIFDLAEKNSIIKHLLDSGMQVFIVSWKNPAKKQSNWGLDTYINELDAGIDAICNITHHRDISLVSACAGGITAIALQAYQKAKNKKTIHNHTVLVTAFSVAGHPTLDLFVNQHSIHQALARTREKGVMEGKELAHIFAWLRPKDLVWNYWVNNNLLGKEPPTMDVLFWDNDSTRLPARLHRDFINVLLNDRFSQGNNFQIDGVPIDIGQLQGDFYFLAGDEDYLMPWKNCYRNMTLLPKANCEFVLSNSGHIQSVLRPPGIGNTRYFTGPSDPQSQSADNWLETAEEHKGSWWGHWTDWLQQRAATTKLPPTQLGNDAYPPLCASPGVYVHEA